MKTKERILEKGRELFNSKGIMSVSLRDIAASLKISYGNLTYHYSNKETLLTWIYIQMMEEYREVAKSFKMDNNLLEKILLIPENTFDISFKYLFLFQDYVEITRNYPSIAEMQQQMIYAGKSDMFNLYITLKEQGLLRQDIGEQEINYLLELGNYMRNFYFMKLLADPSIKEVDKRSGKKAYMHFINRLLYPYLTPKGLLIYDSLLNSN